MHSRKNNLQSSDAAIALRGGLGTLEKLFAMLTWNQLSVAHVRKMQEDNLLYKMAAQRITVQGAPADIIPFLNNN